MTQTRYRSSLDYLVLDITGPSAPQVDDDAIQVCFSKSLSVPTTPTWYSTTNNMDGTVTVLVGPTTPALVTVLTAGCWFIMVKVVDNPSIPIFYGGDLYILD